MQLALESFRQANKYIFATSPDYRSVDYVESVAKFRYTLETVAWLLHDYYLDHAKLHSLSKDEADSIGSLINLVQKICVAIDRGFTEVVPNFLLKCIVCKYGMSTLFTLCDKSNTTDFSWLIPKYLQKGYSENEVSY